MNQRPVIDTTFDVRSDANGRDPDQYSPTLRRYHQLLWSKKLPNGALLDLDASNPRRYLYHKSDLGEFLLSSDTVIRTFRNTREAAPIIQQIPEAERDEFSRFGYTIGGMMVFPGNRIGNKQTINAARGCHPKIKDRFDLTLECIRRHYLAMGSPIGETLARYADFFSLFGDFRGYVDFFLLQDLVTDEYAEVKFFTPFDNFTTPALPDSVDAYKAYRALSIEFVQARNGRIATLAG